MNGVPLQHQNHTIGAQMWSFTLIQDYRTKTDDSVFEWFSSRLHYEKKPPELHLLD